MIEGLRPYPAMKDSGVHWLGTVPTHWERIRLKFLLRPIDRRSSTGRETLLSLRREHGIVVYSEHFARPAQGATTVGYKLVSKGQLVVNRLQANNGLVFDSSLDGLVSPDYSVFEPKGQMQMPYLSLLLRTAMYRHHFRRESTGLGTGSAGFLRLYDDRFLETPVALPTTLEQAAILRFLDYANRRIRRYIRAKQKLIKLLEEQKQASIYQAATRGLQPNVRLKPSGVEWLGDVPEHWELVPNRTLLRLEKRLVGGAWPDHPLLSLTKRGVILRDMENPEGKFPANFESYQEVVPGDLIFCLFDIDETPRFVGLSQLRGMITGAYTRFSCVPAAVEWVHLFYTAMDNGKHLKPLYTGLRKVITKSAFLSAKMPLPSQLEQGELLNYVREAVRTADESVARARHEIELLNEYRTRLIADVVTGKLDVRQVGRHLPEETDEIEELAGAETDTEEPTDDLESSLEEVEA